MRYLLVTHIPFARQPDGTLLLDRLWAEDLRGLTEAVGPVTIAAPEILDPAAMQGWGTGFTTLPLEGSLTFLGLPIRRSRLDLTYPTRLKKVLEQAVEQADLIHTSNLFDPNTDLYAAHDQAVKLGKKTLFVVAEDFYDMLDWEWVRTAPNPLQHHRRRLTLTRLDREVRRRVATASLTFLHTPAAVARYRSHAANAIAIRQPVHERKDVIPLEALEARLAQSATGAPLRLVTACRMQPLKGLDLLLRAIAIVAARGIPVQATLYGEGPQRPNLESLARTLGIAESVAFPGPLSPAPVLRAALAQADLFCMPHLTTDFGRAFFDAIAGACPVLAFRSPASQDTVQEGIDGLLASNADPESLALAIERLHTDRSLLATLSQAARRRALTNTKSFWNHYRATLIHELFQ